MCKVCAGPNPNRILLTRQPPSVDEETAANATALATVLEQWHAEVTAAVQSGAITLTSAEAARRALQRLLADTVKAAWDGVLEDMWVRGAELGRETHIRRHGLAASYDIPRDAVYDALRENGDEAAEHIQLRMTGDLGAALADAYAEGHSIDEIAATLQEDVFPEIEGYEARRVAQTETVAGANRGALTAYEDADSVTGKQWLATSDERTRVSHRGADRQEAPIDGWFIIGGERAQFPGDPTLSVSERANCRCTLAPSLG